MMFKKQDKMPANMLTQFNRTKITFLSYKHPFHQYFLIYMHILFSDVVIEMISNFAIAYFISAGNNVECMHQRFWVTSKQGEDFSGPT